MQTLTLYSDERVAPNVLGHSRTVLGRALPGIVVLMLITAACSDPTGSEEYQALQANLDGTTATLAGVRTELAAANAALAGTQSDLDAAQAALEEAQAALSDRAAQAAALEEALGEVVVAVSNARTAADALFIELVHLGGDDASDLAAGVPVEIADEIVQSLRLPGGTWVGFNDTDPTLVWSNRIRDVGDPDLDAALDTWWNAPLDSDEVWISWVEIRFRLTRALLESLEAADNAAEPPGAG